MGARGRYGWDVSDQPYGEPPDPFPGDPDGGDGITLSEAERGELIEDLSDLEVYEALLEPRGIRGLVVDCEDCQVPHYYGWALFKANLRHLLRAGRTRVHEPAFEPDPDQYVSWDYARGYAEGVQDSLESGGADREVDRPG
jgi:hypothetical protein